MYCPYCKSDLELVNGEFYCKSGKCYFSKHLSSNFIEQITNLKKSQFSGIAQSSNTHGRFFCVNCSEQMQKVEDLYERCNSCGFVIDKPTYYRIVERNPHE